MAIRRATPRGGGCIGTTSSSVAARGPLVHRKRIPSNAGADPDCSSPRLLYNPGGGRRAADRKSKHPVSLHVGDRFELQLTREAWEAGRVPLEGGFRYLASPTGEPVTVTLRVATGRSLPGVWDGVAGVLAAPGLAALLASGPTPAVPGAGASRPEAPGPAAPGAITDANVATGPGRLGLDVEAIDAPVFRLSLIGPAPHPGAADAARESGQTPREVGGVPVRFDPADAEILAAFADGVCSPLPVYELNRWATAIALTPGFEELVSLPFLRDVIAYEHQVAAVKTVLNRMRGRALAC